MSESAPAAPALDRTPQPTAEEEDWLTGAAACSIENGEDCEACQ